MQFCHKIYVLIFLFLFTMISSACACLFSKKNDQNDCNQSDDAKYHMNADNLNDDAIHFSLKAVEKAVNVWDVCDNLNYKDQQKLQYVFDVCDYYRKPDLLDTITNNLSI